MYLISRQIKDHCSTKLIIKSQLDFEIGRETFVHNFVPSRCCPSVTQQTRMSLVYSVGFHDRFTEVSMQIRSVTISTKRTQKSCSAHASSLSPQGAFRLNASGQFHGSIYHVFALQHM